MRLKHAKIVNFRSIRTLDLELGPFTTLLGPNNHGKSNLLAALDFFLSPGFKISSQDFFSNRAAGDNTATVEVEFTDLTAQEKTTFLKYVSPTNSIKIQKWATITDTGDVETGYRGYIRQPNIWWLRDEAFDRLKTREAITEEVNHVPELAPLLQGSGRVSKDKIIEFQSQYILTNSATLTFDETLETSPLLGIKNIAGGTLPDFFLIPAVRDLEEETKTTGTSTFGRLLQRAIAEMTSRDPRFTKLQTRLTELVGTLNDRPAEITAENETELIRLERLIKSELTTWGVDVSITVTPPDVKKVFELGTEIWLDDGLKTQAERKGHGLQRALIFSLIRAWSSTLRSNPAAQTPRARIASESVIFAFEEPELFLHPQAQRLLYDSLRTLSQTSEHQVLICTHSTHFVNLEQYRGIAIIQKPSIAIGTSVRQCARDLFAGQALQDRKKRFHMAAWINPDRGEMFFARKVVLVEGETEKTILPYLASRLNCFDYNVSIIDCGSKHNIPLYVEILNAFQLKYFIVHDEDPLPNPIPADWDPDKVRQKTQTFQLNTDIQHLIDANLGGVFVVPTDIEQFAGVPRGQGEKKGKALAAVDHFETLQDQQIPAALVTLVRQVYS